jgi:hypothetical protein
MSNEKSIETNEDEIMELITPAAAASKSPDIIEDEIAEIHAISPPATEDEIGMSKDALGALINKIENNGKLSKIEELMYHKRDGNFWAQIPIQSFDKWMEQINGCHATHQDKYWLQKVMVNDRKKTGDAFWELPTLETLDCLHAVLDQLHHTKESGDILSVGCGIALIEKLIIDRYNFDSIICTDDFPEEVGYPNRNKDAQQMPVENLSYTDAVKKYPASNIIFSCWTPNDLNITKLLLEANPKIDVFVFIGEPNVNETKDVKPDEDGNVQIGEMMGKSRGGSTGCPEMYEIDGWSLTSIFPKSLSQIDSIPAKLHHSQIDVLYKKESYPTFTGDAMKDFPGLKKEWMDPKGAYVVDFADVMDDIMSADMSDNPEGKMMQMRAMMEMMKMTGMGEDENGKSSLPDMNGCPMQ